MAKKPLISFEQRVWDELINPCATGAWIDSVIAESQKDSDAPFADSGPILERMLSAGFTREEIGRLARHATFACAHSLLHSLDEEGLLTRRASCMHEDLLSSDPSGMEGRPGSWPVKPQPSPKSSSTPLKIPKISKVAFSPDGKLLLAARTTITSGIIQLWDHRQREVVREFSSLPNLRGLAWSPDSSLIAAGSHGGVVCVHEAQTGKIIWKSKPTKKENSNVAFSHDGKSLFSAGNEQYIRVFDAQSGKPADPIDLGERAAGVHVATSPVGNLLALSNFTTVILWDISRREELRRFSLSDRGADKLQFFPDGQHLLTVAYDETNVWEVKTGKHVRKLEVTHGQGAAISPDGNVIAISEREGPARLIEWRSGQTIGEAPSDPAFRWSLSFSPDQLYLAIATINFGYLFDVATILKPSTKT